MTDSKGETSGKALSRRDLDWTDDEGDLMSLRCGRASWEECSARASAEEIAACLLANPEARMAVLEKLAPDASGLCSAHQKPCAQCYWLLVKRVTEAEARLPHLEEAAELLRKLVPSPSTSGRDDVKNWFSRDQAISVPTAESGKDSAGFDSPGVINQENGAPAKQWASQVDPAPVAEAPERVTHENARGYASALPLVSARRLLAYVGQQERLEREVVELRKELAEEKKRGDDHLTAYVRRGDFIAKMAAECGYKPLGEATVEDQLAFGVAALNRNLTQEIAEHQRHHDTEAQLNAKLSESERKLGEAARELAARHQNQRKVEAERNALRGLIGEFADHCVDSGWQNIGDELRSKRDALYDGAPPTATDGARER